jgi:large subunit ribosomal protein L9
MQIILLDKVVNVGNLGDIVKVKDGYARNFLIPSGRARRATESAKKEFEIKRAELEKQAAAKLAEAQAQGTKLGGTVIKLTQKAGVDGRLFGSVTNVVGDNTVTVALHTDVVAEITVTVYGESA